MVIIDELGEGSGLRDGGLVFFSGGDAGIQGKDLLLLLHSLRQGVR